MEAETGTTGSGSAALGTVAAVAGAMAAVAGAMTAAGTGGRTAAALIAPGVAAMAGTTGVIAGLAVAVLEKTNAGLVGSHGGLLEQGPSLSWEWVCKCEMSKVLLKKLHAMHCRHHHLSVTSGVH